MFRLSVNTALVSPPAPPLFFPSLARFFVRPRLFENLEQATQDGAVPLLITFFVTTFQVGSITSMSLSS